MQGVFFFVRQVLKKKMDNVIDIRFRQKNLLPFHRFSFGHIK